MEAASAAVPVEGRRGVLISPTWLVVCGIGAVIAIVGLFLKAFNLPGDLTYPGTNSVWSATTSGKVVLAFIVLTVVFLARAIHKHRQGYLRGAYITAFIALGWAVAAAAAGFTVTTTTGRTVDLDAAIGPVVMSVGCAIMFASLLIARFTEKRS
ncbi:MAG: hypothetical protein ACJ764_06750 [Solirubrobacteraceae bacterium]